MSGPGDIGGDVSGDEAAWRDLIARYDVPADTQVSDPPWPAREDLPRPAADGAEQAAAASARTELPGPDPTSPDAIKADLASADLINQDPPDSADPIIMRDLPGGAASAYLPTDRTRIIRYAGNPRDYSPSEEEDEPYVSAPLPPPAKLDPVAKAAWVGVIGGPGYLLVVSLFLHMAVSATAAFVAVGAFVGGFATLIVKLGDRPPRDDDDDGAVL
jgi:hypothetical protein